MRQRVTLTIERLSEGGEGIAHVEGKVLFVPHSAPGDILEADIIDQHKRFARAVPRRLLRPSADRTKPPCPYHYQGLSSERADGSPREIRPERGEKACCGGCTWQHLAYEAQLRAKQRVVLETLEHVGGLRGIRVNPVMGMRDPWRYRNKVQMPVRGLPGGRGLISGFYAPGTHDVVPIDDCLVQPAFAGRLASRARSLLERYRLPAYDENRRSGWIRHLLVRTANSNGPEANKETPEALLTFVTRTPEFAHQSEIVSELVRDFPSLVGIHQNIQPAHTNVILGRRWRLLAGRGYLEEQLGSLRFRLSPGSFFQVNRAQAVVLYDVVKRMCGQGDRLLDLYAGVGAIALWLAGQFREVGGVEEWPDAAKDAETNARLNGIPNARFMASTAEHFLNGMPRLQRPPTVIVDPPRAGCSRAVLSSLIALRPNRLVYVSCEPATLARDLSVLAKGGFRVEDVQPVDMFPHTPHIETAVKLTHG